jgi:hypothetical protein
MKKSSSIGAGGALAQARAVLVSAEVVVLRPIAPFRMKIKDEIANDIKWAENDRADGQVPHKLSGKKEVAYVEISDDSKKSQEKSVDDHDCD